MASTVVATVESGALPAVLRATGAGRVALEVDTAAVPMAEEVADEAAVALVETVESRARVAVAEA